jgi:hypothetical protein
MPVVINDVSVETLPTVSQDNRPPHSQMAVSAPEYEMVKMLALVEERKVRLEID